MGEFVRPVTFLKNVLQNGVGRYVCQLQRITFEFCKSRGDSRGMRDYVENQLIDFARNNPGVVIYIQPRKLRAPYLVAEYLNGAVVKLPTAHYKEDEVKRWLNHLRTRIGGPIMRLEKQWHTDVPSIQGQWTPFTNIPSSMNVAKLPDDKLTECDTYHKTATEIILEMARNQKAKQESGQDTDSEAS